jgi:hypothetical protein
LLQQLTLLLAIVSQMECWGEAKALQHKPYG